MSRKDKTFVPMNAAKLQKLFHQKFYLKIMNFAKQHYIRCNEQWTIDEKSKMYSMKEEHLNYEHIIDEISYKYEQAIYATDNSNDDICTHQRLKLNELNFNQNIRQFINNQEYDKPNGKESRLFAVDRFNLQPKYCHLDNTSMRLHSNLTNLASDIRSNLIYRYPLYNVDITNSQPLMLSRLLLATQHKHFLDTKRYIDLTTNGKIYEYILEKLPETFFEDDDFEKKRKKVKQQFFKLFYNNPKYQKLDDVFFTAFCTEFPNVYNFILDQKENDYKQFSINMQKAESDLMIQTIYRRIMNERPDIMALTIHDSVVTSESEIGYVQDIICDEFEKKYKLKPTLETKRL
jgi:hypothetical protein